MYLQTYLDWTGIDIKNYALENTTYSAFYFFWRDELFERCMKLFEENTDPIPPHEIEVRLMIQGHCLIAPLKGELTAFFGEPNGISKYRDMLPFYCAHSPVWSGNVKVGPDGIGEVIWNNKIMNPLLDLIHHYAIILAHTEVSYIWEAVNARSNNGVPVAKTEKQKISIKNFLAHIFNGKFDVVTDIGDMGLEYVGSHTNVTQGVESLWEARQKILNAFLNDIGIKTGLDKRSNSVDDEVNADTPSLLINLNDMLDSRKKGFDAVNKHFGTNWTVELNKDLNYINEFTDPKVEEKIDEKIQSN